MSVTLAPEERSVYSTSRPIGTATLPAVVAAAALYVLLLGLLVAAYAGDLSALVCVDEAAVGQPPYEQVTTGFAKGGYDGQYCYTVARNPWTVHPGLQPVRHLRILYPALAWALTGGDAVALFWALPLVNLLVVVGLAFVGTVLAREYKLSPWWGALLPVVVNAYMPALRDLTDPLGVLTVLTVLLGWKRRWPVWALTLTALAAVLCRETNLLVLGVVFLAAIQERRWVPAAALVGCVGVWLAWVVVLTNLYGSWPFLPSGGNLGVPLAGVLHHFQHRAQELQSRTLWLAHVLALGFLATQAVLAGILLAGKGDWVVKGVTVLGLVLLLCGGSDVYASPWSMLRTFAWVPLGVWLLSVQSGRTWPIMVLSATLFWPLLVVVQAWF